MYTDGSREPRDSQSQGCLSVLTQHQQLRSGTDSLTVREEGDRTDFSVLSQNALVQRAESLSGM